MSDVVDNVEKWQKRQEDHDKREEERHARDAEAYQLHALEVNSLILHRAEYEKSCAAQVELSKEFNKICAVNMVNNERAATALERIAESLERPVKILASNMEEKP